MFLLGRVKAEPRAPEVTVNLKRGSMKEKWGLGLVWRLEGNRLEVAVSKVAMFSAAAKAGIKPGNTIVLLNDWKIEAMDQYQAQSYELREDKPTFRLFINVKFKRAT